SNDYDPRSFDYQQFQAEIANAIRPGFARTSKAVNAFALCTDHDGMTIVEAANTMTPRTTDDERWNPFTWSEAEFIPELDVPYRMILAKHLDVPFETNDDTLRDGVYECFVRALEHLRQEGVFGSNPDFVLLAFIKDHWQIRGMAERLNS